MKMHFLNRTTVRFSLGLGHNQKYFLGQSFGSVGHNAAVNNGVNICQMPVLMVMMLMISLFMMMRFVMQMHIKITTADAVRRLAFNMVIKTFQFQAFQHGIKPAPISAQIKQCRNRHIAADSAGTFQIKIFSHDYSASSTFYRPKPPHRNRCQY